MWFVLNVSPFHCAAHCVVCLHDSEPFQPQSLRRGSEKTSKHLGIEKADKFEYDDFKVTILSDLRKLLGIQNVCLRDTGYRQVFR